MEDEKVQKLNMYRYLWYHSFQTRFAGLRACVNLKYQVLLVLLVLSTEDFQRRPIAFD